MNIYEIILKTIELKEKDDKFGSLNQEYYISLLNILFKMEVKEYDNQ